MLNATSQHQGVPMRILHRNAFTTRQEGGNPAGVVLSSGLGERQMLAIAAKLGYSESAFLPDSIGGDDQPTGTGVRIRYFSPAKEIDFCGHATIAAACVVADLFDRESVTFLTNSGPVNVSMTEYDGIWRAGFRSIPPAVDTADRDLVDRALRLLGYQASDLDSDLSVNYANAGAGHLILPIRHQPTLDRLDYEFEPMAQLMREYDLTTIALVRREDKRTFRARNIFAIGGVVEDPATGAAAAALGGYLRHHSIIESGTVTIHQGIEMGRPSLIEVEIPADAAQGILVSGPAVPIEAAC